MDLWQPRKLKANKMKLVIAYKVDLTPKIAIETHYQSSDIGLG